MGCSKIYEEITPIFQEVFDDDQLVPHEKMTANDVEEWDSLSHIRLICAVEAHYGVRFSTAEISALEKVGDFVGLIEKKQQG